MNLFKQGDFVCIEVDGEVLKFDSELSGMLSGISGKCFFNRKNTVPRAVINTANGLVSVRQLVVGSVPPNHCVVHVDGDYCNHTRSNLRIVPRGQVWAYSIDMCTDDTRCIRKHRISGYHVIVQSKSYGRYKSKEVAIQCRNEVIRDLKGGCLKDSKYYSGKYKKIEKDIYETSRSLHTVKN